MKSGQPDADPVMNAGEKRTSVVFCWELGGGLGHISKAVILAEKLLAQGCRVSFLLRDLQSIDGLLPRGAYQVLQAPVSWWVPEGWPAPADHAELLMHAGLADAAGLRGRVRAWTDTFDALEADLVIADHAPTALLAARCLGLRTVNFALGFFAPPPPWPVFRTWEPAPAQRLALARQLVEREVNACLRSYGAAPLGALHELLDADLDVLLTVPELDHYPREASAAHRGCVMLDDVGQAPAWPTAPGPRVFAYLRPDLPGLDELLAALATCGAAVLVRCAGIDAALQKRWASASLAFTAQWVRMVDVARDAAAVVCSGTDTAHGMALRGVPVLSLPMNAEQRIGGQRLQACGAGLWALPGSDRTVLASRLRDLLGDPAIRAAAQALAQRHGPQDGRRVLEGVARDCVALLQRTPTA